jgi:hypothetical protein
MVINLKPDQRKALIHIGYAVGNAGGATREKIKVLGARDEQRDNYLAFFCDKKICCKTGEVYTLTIIGQSMFDNIVRREK